MKFKDMPYRRIEKEELEKQFASIIEEFKAAGSGEEQFAVHRKYYELSDDITTNLMISYIRHSVDTTDEFYSAEKDYYDEIEPIISNWNQIYQKLVYYSPYRDYLEEKIGPVAFKNMEISFKAFDEFNSSNLRSQILLPSWAIT